MTIVLIADGAPEHGLGHLARSSAVAAALRARGGEIAAFAHGAREPRAVDGITWAPYEAPPEARAIVLDTYTMPAADRAALAERAPLVVFDDGGELPAGTALVIAPWRTEGAEPAGGAAGAPVAEGAATVLAGLRHAALRPPFWGLPERRVRDRVERVLVATGGGPLAAEGARLAADVRAALGDAAVALVRGPFAGVDSPAGVEPVDAPSSLLEHLLAADVVVTAAGQTSLEAVATGAATIAIPFVDNQRGNAAALSDAGAAAVAGPAEAPAIAGALTDPARRIALARAGQAAVDGYGALRIAFRIERI